MAHPRQVGEARAELAAERFFAGARQQQRLDLARGQHTREPLEVLDRPRAHVSGRRELHDRSARAPKALDQVAAVPQLARGQRRITPELEMRLEVLAQRDGLVQRVLATELDGPRAFRQYARTEPLAPIAAREADAPVRSARQHREGALQVALGIDRELGREAGELVAQLEPRASSAATLEPQHVREPRQALEQRSELALDHPGDLGARKALAQHVVERQRQHDVAEVRKPDDRDARGLVNLFGACGSHGSSLRWRADDTPLDDDACALAGRGARGARRVIRRISTKLLLAVLAAVVVPFVGFAWYVDTQVAGRLSRDVVLYSLKGLAADLASRVDRDIEEFQNNVALWALDPGCHLAIDESEKERAGELEPDDENLRLLRDLQKEQFDYWVIGKRDYDLFLLVGADGHLVVSNTLGPSGLRLSDEALADLNARNYADEDWFKVAFEKAKAGQAHITPRRISDLLPPRNKTAGKHAENYHIGFSSPVFTASKDGEPSLFAGVLYALVNWSRIQDEVESPVLKSYFQGLVGQDEFPSAYGWIWDRDGDTILAHANPELYDTRVSGPEINLPQMVADVREADWGLYREYTFRGERKNAAFKHTREGWIVGVGINNDDIFKGVNELRELLFKATLVVLGVAVLWMLVIARRTTGPILLLREHVKRVAHGDLDARVDVRTGDELGELGAALNDMTAEIAASREKLVKAEKEAAWREMARQVAHDIKNPLTPIQISIDLAKRAHVEKSPEFPQIFERTVEIVSRQVAHLREIASDFHALTGARPASLADVDVGKLLDEVLALEAAWARQLGVAIERRGTSGSVRADAALLRRVLLNLVSNALEAMPQGGQLVALVEPRGEQVLIEIRDSGVGVPEDVRKRLFEPYFTTRTTGTGLGLAIAKRVVEDFGGTIELVNAQPAPGTVARVTLPRA